MNVLYISYDGLTDPLGQSQIMPYLISCSEHELNFTVVSFEKKKNLKSEYQKVKSQLDKAGISWIPKTYHKWPPLFSSLVDLQQMIRVAKKVHREKTIRLIHCRSYVPAYAAFLLKKKLGTKVLFDMRGFWADERLEGNIWRKDNPVQYGIYNHLKKMERKWWYDADHMISLTEKGKKYICNNQTPDFEKKITVIPCCADERLFTTEIDEKVKISLKNELSINHSEKLLIYVGSLGTWYLGREMMAQFANLFERKFLDRFLWITRDSEERIMALTSEFNLPKSSVIVRSASRDEVPVYLSIADLGIFYIRSTFSKSASSPTKLGEMLLCGLPVITNTGVGDLNTFFSDNDVGHIHEIDREKTMFVDDETIRTLMSKSKEEIRKVGLKNLSLSIATERYLEIYNTLK